MLLDLLFQGLNSIESGIPSTFKFIGDQAIIGINRVILFKRPLGFISSRLKLILQRG